MENNQTKKCAKCKIFLDVKYFSKNKSKFDGYGTECKVCCITINREYRRTKVGLIGQIYSHQKSKSRKRNYNPPSYTKQELVDWTLNQPKFHALFAEWKLSNYNVNLTPSVDRKNDYISYTINNIQIMTWEENSKKGGTDRFFGINRKPLKAVIQFAKDGVVITEFFSIAEAFRKTNIHQISSCCLGKRKTAGGYIWKFKESNN